MGFLDKKVNFPHSKEHPPIFVSRATFSRMRRTIRSFFLLRTMSGHFGVTNCWTFGAKSAQNRRKMTRQGPFQQFFLKVPFLLKSYGQEKFPAYPVVTSYP